MAERARPKERERKRPELSNFSYNLSNILLEGPDGKKGSDIPHETLAVFHKGSVVDRSSYWGEKAPNTSFAHQMYTWLGDEKSGIAQWVGKQTDGDVVAMLMEVGLKGDPKTTKQDLQDPRVVKVISAINADLQKAGEPLLDTNTLSEDKARSLIFYANYLSGEKGAEDTKSFIDVITAVAQKQSNGNIDAAIAKLQKIAPLLATAGEEAQYALGALLVAKTHAMGAREMLEKANGSIPPTDDELRVLNFFQKHENALDATAPLELSKPYVIPQVLQDLQPKPTPDHPYWIDKNIPADFAQNLTPEQLKELEMHKPLFVQVRYEDTPQGKALMRTLNRGVFDPAFTLAEDKRFKNAEVLTHNDSGLFALAAASAETPEQQVMVYQQLGETILRTHLQNPFLLQEFLQVQDEGSRDVLLNNEAEIFLPQFMNKLHELNLHVSTEIRKQYPNIQTIKPGSPEEELHTKLVAEADEQLVEFRNDLFDNIGEKSVRLLAISPREVPEGAIGQLPFEINIPKTMEAWPERVKALQEALQTEPLTLTYEQIRQIEFLAHSVDTAKVMEWLGAKGAVAVVQPKETVQPTSEQTGGEETEQNRTHMKLEEFFEQFDNLEEKVPATILPRRDTMAIQDSSHMAVFPTASEDPLRFEITDDRGELAVYTISENTENAAKPEYNVRNTFLTQLLQKDSLSLHSFEQLAKAGHGQNTLLAYVLEASGDAKQQTTLLTNIFQELGDIYKNHPGLVEQLRSYFEGVNEKVPFNEIQDVKRLLGSSESAVERITQLQAKLEAHQDITLQDLRDIGIFALPFNLQYIAERMEQAYRMREATPNVTTPAK